MTVRTAGQPEDTAEDSQNADGQRLTELMERLREKLADFESEGLDEILACLAKCQYQGVPLTKLTEEIRVKTSDFDFLGASGLLERWESERSGM